MRDRVVKKTHVMKVKVKSTKELVEFIRTYKIKEESYEIHDLPENCRFRKLLLEHTDNDDSPKDNGFSWTLVPNFEITGETSRISSKQRFIDSTNCLRNLELEIRQTDYVFVGDIEQYVQKEREENTTRVIQLQSWVEGTLTGHTPTVEETRGKIGKLAQFLDSCEFNKQLPKDSKEKLKRAAKILFEESEFLSQVLNKELRVL